MLNINASSRHPGGFRVDFSGQGSSAFVRGASASSPPTSATVRISDEAKALDAASSDPSDKAAEALRAEIQKVDFRSTNQQELAHLAQLLSESGELDLDHAGSLLSASGDVIPPRGPTERFDLTAQFAHVEELTAQLAKSDPTLRWAAGYASGLVDMLNDLQSFARSDRLHVRP